MFILYAVVVGLAIGLVLGGRLLAIGDVRLRWWPLILVGFVVQVVLFSEQVSSVIGEAGPPLYIVSTAMVGVAVARNITIPGMPLIALGAVCNMTAILANGGYMPSTAEALGAIGKTTSTVYSNSSLVPEPAFPWLIDRFVLPSWLPFTNVFSAGDVILGVGVAWLIVATMLAGRRRPADRPTPVSAPVR